VSVQLEHVLTGERRRRSEEERDAVVDDLACGVAEACMLREAWRGWLAADGRCQPGQ